MPSKRFSALALLGWLNLNVRRRYSVTLLSKRHSGQACGLERVDSQGRILMENPQGLKNASF